MATKNIVPRANGEGTLGSSSKLWKEVHHVTSSFGDTKLIEDASNNLQLSGGPLVAASGLSGSLTQLSDGSSYIKQGSNITVTSASNGAVTIASTDTNTTYSAGSGLALSSTTFSARSSVTVTVAGGKFVIDGTSQQTLSLAKGVVYYFDQSDNTNATHPLRFSTTPDGSHGGGSEYTTGRTTDGTPGSAGAYTQIILEQDAPSVLYYYCTGHSGMGGKVETAPDALLTGNRTFANNLTVTGDLTVNGTTTTVNTDNLIVEDPVVLLGSGASSANTNGGLALLSGSSVASNSLVIGRVANDTWGVGRKDVAGGSVTTLADMTLVDFKAAGITASSLTLGSTEVTSTAAELNLLDGGTSVGSSITLANTDGFVVNDNGTMKTIPASDIKTYVNASAAGSVAADDIAAGDAAVTLTTTSGATLINSANNSTTTVSGSNVALTSENDVTVTGDLKPAAADTYSLGTTAAEWKDLYLGDDGKINFGNDQDVNFTHNPDSGVTLLMNPTTDSPTFELKTTNTGQYVGPILKFNHDSSSPAANDTIGYVNFYADSSTGVSRGYGSIRTSIVSTTNSDEIGKLQIGVLANGSNSYDAITIEGTSNSGIATVDLPDHNGSTGGLKLGGTLVTSTADELNILDGVTATSSELNLLDGGTSVGSSITIADSDGFIVNDNGTMKTIPASDLSTYVGGGGGGSTAADDITAGDAAVNISTTTGNITLDTDDGDIILDPAGKDVIFKVTGSDYLKFTMNGDDTVISGSKQDGDLVFSFNGSEYLRMGTGFSGGGDGLALTSGNDLFLKNGATIRFDYAYGDQSISPSSTYGFGLESEGAIIKLTRYGNVFLRDKYSTNGEKQAIFLQAHGGKIDFLKGGQSGVGGPYTYNQLAPLDVSGQSDRDRMLLISGSFASNNSVITHFNVGDLGTTSAIELSGSGEIIKLGQDSPSTGEFLKWDGTKVVWDSASSSTAADDITTGDAAVTIATSAGNITLDAQGNDTDIIFKGTDGSSDTTFLTLDGSEAGAASFNSNVTVGGDLAVNGDTSTFASANANDPLVIIKNTTNDADGARLRFVKDKGAAGAANDVAGLIEFYADDANQDQVKFSEIKSQVAVHTNGQEGGKLTLSVAEHDGTLTQGLLLSDGNADGEIDVTIAAGAASMTTVSGDLTVNGDTSTFASANSTDPLVIVKNTTNDANGARLRFVKDKGAAGADNDVAGLIEFYADDDAQDQVKFGEIKTQVADASNGAEGGKLTLSVATHDGELQPGLVLTDGDAEDEVDVTIGNGSNSLTTVAGDAKVTGDIIIDDGGSLKEAGGTAAFTFDGDGHVTKIGQDSPSSGQFLKWDGSKAVWDAASGGSGGGGKHELTKTTGSNFTIPAFGGSTKERQLYIVNSSNAVTATLPNPGPTTYDGYEINIKRLGTGIVHITGSVNIDSSHTFDLPSQYSNITLVATGSQYVII